jgi:hypothetical protein
MGRVGRTSARIETPPQTTAFGICPDVGSAAHPDGTK